MGERSAIWWMCIGCIIYQTMKKRPKILVGAIIAGVLGCVALFVLQSKNETIRTWFNWAFDLFVTFAKQGKFETELSNVLLEQMLFVSEVRTILFGDGMYTTLSGYYMSTDAGIMRSLLFGGIGFALLRYLSFYIPLGLSLFKTKMKSADKIMYLWALLLCIVFEVKGEILFSCIPIFIWIMALERYERWRKEKWSRDLSFRRLFKMYILNIWVIILAGVIVAGAMGIVLKGKSEASVTQSVYLVYDLDTEQKETLETKKNVYFDAYKGLISGNALLDSNEFSKEEKALLSGITTEVESSCYTLTMNAQNVKEDEKLLNRYVEASEKWMQGKI